MAALGSVTTASAVTPTPAISAPVSRVAPASATQDDGKDNSQQKASSTGQGADTTAPTPVIYGTLASSNASTVPTRGSVVDLSA